MATTQGTPVGEPRAQIFPLGPRYQGVVALRASGTPGGRVRSAMASILVIDDNEDALLIIAYQLTRHGHTLMTAHDGSTGLAVAQREHPDLILCDIRMPQMSGYEVVDRLKHDPTLRQTPVVALTAVGEVDRAKALAAGFDAYISKPVPAQTLIEHIEAVLVRRRNGRAEN